MPQRDPGTNSLLSHTHEQSLEKCEGTRSQWHSVTVFVKFPPISPSLAFFLYADMVAVQVCANRGGGTREWITLVSWSASANVFKCTPHITWEINLNFCKPHQVEFLLLASQTIPNWFSRFYKAWLLWLEYEMCPIGLCVWSPDDGGVWEGCGTYSRQTCWRKCVTRVRIWGFIAWFCFQTADATWQAVLPFPVPYFPTTMDFSPLGTERQNKPSVL